MLWPPGQERITTWIALAAFLLTACGPANSRNTDLTTRPIRAVTPIGMITDIVRRRGLRRKINWASDCWPGVHWHLK